MATRRRGGLRRLVSEAARASLAERDKQMALLGCPPEGPPWPYIIDDKIATRVSREQGPLATSQAQLVRRLRAFRYPYVASHPYGVSNQQGKTFFAHVQSLGLMQFLLNPPFLWEVRRAWFFRRHYELEMEQRKNGVSQHGYPLSFHKEMMFAISTHLNKISKIANNHKVSKKWFAEHYGQTMKQLLSEASVIYPELLRSQPKPHSKIQPHSLDVESRLDIFDAITAELARRRMSNNTLTEQLTALICSAPDCVTTHKLDPSPDLVRRNIRDRRKKP
jgi:hypothetical protein